jgi:predicted cobalt transporter CbtA
MLRVLAIAVVVGLISGLIVGGFHNIFTVPVIERAIALEEERGAAEAKAKGMVMEEEKPLVSLGVQRIGMAVGTAIYGIILGLVFTGGYALLRRVVPGWKPLALALVVGALGFWSLSLFPFIKFPLNPPGVGDPGTLTFRQGFQTLFFFLSAAGAVGLIVGLKWVVSRASTSDARRASPLHYGLVVLAYGGFLAVISLIVPGNPDPVPVPVDLLSLFRALTMIGQFLLWLLIAAGVALYISLKGQSTSTRTVRSAFRPTS